MINVSVLTMQLDFLKEIIDHPQVLPLLQIFRTYAFPGCVDLNIGVVQLQRPDLRVYTQRPTHN
jgi:hypothetical protein